MVKYKDRNLLIENSQTFYLVETDTTKLDNIYHLDVFASTTELHFCLCKK